MNIQLENFARANLELPINDVVDRMPVDRLDWAMTQVANTITKNETNDSIHG